MKYYCTGEVLENGYLKCVLPDRDMPDEKDFKEAYFNTRSNISPTNYVAFNKAVVEYKEHLASLPVAALVVGGKTGWLEGYEERYEAYSNTTGWTEVPYSVWLDIDSEKRTVLTKITNDMIVGQARCPHCGYITSTGGIIEHVKHCQKRMKAHPIEVPNSELPPHLKKPEEKSDDIPAGNQIFSIYQKMPDSPLKKFLYQWFGKYDDSDYTPVVEDRPTKDFLPVLQENWQAQIAGYYNHDKTDTERAIRQAVIDEYKDLISIYKNGKWKGEDRPKWENLLNELEEYFDNKADADVDDEKFIPNKEMQLLAEIRKVRAGQNT